MSQNKKKCFVCENLFDAQNLILNSDVNLPVCNTCAGTENEKNKVRELLDSLADGFVCGCI